MVSILLPDFETSGLEDCFNFTYYSIAEFKITDLLNKSIIDGYVNNGELVIASNNQNFDTYEFLLVDRKLLLKLDKNLYYSLNAVHLSKYQTKSEDEHILFEIDLESCDINKLKQELLYNDILEKLEINFVWKPLSNDTCPSSIAKFFANLNYNVNAINNQSGTNYLFDLKFPKIPSTNKSEPYEWDEFIECIGMMMLGCDFEKNNCSSYELPGKIIQIGRGQIINFKGFIPHFILDKAFKEILKILKENSKLPYIALSSIPYVSFQKDFNAKTIIVSSENIHIAE
ncbi:hypothetical protein PVAND_013144 [Polypedilum vanderplanki]|uniref:Uncharacterized protein n=1 Tax=Polypedilum vanderplanki TaxID=319348 RepID=A0A9J6CQK8_POLVA|nr:hypothetical protein PVAND_013144 [Polypedilum vanderplanki]